MEKNIIDHNRKTCNCRQPTICPQDGNCLSSSIIYKATVSLEKEQVAYIGLTSTTSKERYNNNIKSFNHEKYENETELSKYVWKLKKKNKKCNCCRLRGFLFASMMGLDNILLKRLSVRMFSQSLFTFFMKVAMDGWNCVMKVMRFSLVFLLELRVKDLVRTMCDAWLICLEINL